MKQGKKEGRKEGRKEGKKEGNGWLFECNRVLMGNMSISVLRFTFLFPSHFSFTAQLSHCSQAHIARYLLNYVNNNNEYHEEWRNCQTFAADFVGLLSGVKRVEPYHQVCRVLHKQRHHWFLYDFHGNSSNNNNDSSRKEGDADAEKR